MEKANIKLIIAFLAVACAFGIAWYGSTSEPPYPDDIPDDTTEDPFAIDDAEALEAPVGRAEVGYEIAATRCSGCHEIGQRSSSPIPNAPTFKVLADRWPVDYLAEALAEGISVRHGADIKMPEFVFTPQEIEDFLVYMESLKN